MNKTIQSIILITLLTSLCSCSGGANNNSGNNNNNNAHTLNSSAWQAVNNAANSGVNLVFNSITAANGNLYAGGSDDVNNALVITTNPNSDNIWSLLSNGFLPNTYHNVTEVSALTVSPQGSIYAATNTNHLNGQVYSINSIDGSWLNIGNGVVPDGSLINAISIDTSTNNLYVATAGYNAINNTYTSNVYTSLASVGAWETAVASPLPNGGVINSMIAQNGILYIAAGGYDSTSNQNFGEVYSNTGSANSWQQLGGNLPDAGTVNSIALDASHNLLYAATSAAHVYMLSLPAGSWQLVGASTIPDNNPITALTLGANGLLIAASAAGNVYAINPSINNNAWQQLGQGSMPDNWSINSLTTVNNTVYTATQGGDIYQSTIATN